MIQMCRRIESLAARETFAELINVWDVYMENPSRAQHRHERIANAHGIAKMLKDLIAGYHIEP